MPWEAKRWVLFAALMAAMSLYALTYRPYGRPRKPASPAGMTEPPTDAGSPNVGNREER